MKKISLPLPLALLLILSGAHLLLSFGTPLAVCLYTLNEVVGFAVLRLFQAAGLLLLLFSLGCAFGASGDGARPYVLLLMATIAHLFGTILGLLWQAIFLRLPISAEELSLLLGSLLDSAVLPLFVTYLIVYFAVLKKGTGGEPRDHRDLSSPTVRASLLASLIFFLYRLIGQISETVETVRNAMGFDFLKTGEKLTMILDYLPVIGVSVLGYFVLLKAHRLYRAAAEREKISE